MNKNYNIEIIYICNNCGVTLHLSPESENVCIKVRKAFYTFLNGGPTVPLSIHGISHRCNNSVVGFAEFKKIIILEEGEKDAT